MQQHDLIRIGLPAWEQGRGIDRPQCADALAPRVQLTEAVHDALPVLRLAESAPRVLDRHRRHTGVLDLLQRRGRSLAERPEDAGRDVARCGQQNGFAPQPPGPLRSLVLQHVLLSLAVPRQATELPLQPHLGAALSDRVSNSVSELLQAVPERPHRLALHFGQPRVAGGLGLRVLGALEEQLDGARQQAATVFLEHLDAPGRCLSG
mmetsp:Transcript_57466/g.175004  ORF Transcript_57466/g.175004 Transcript_57466/m.175004 type:complete len:207 (-) Transcript_57466:400-1020(-)